MSTEMYEASRGYVKSGLNIIPCSGKDKRPVLSWSEYQTKKVNPNVLQGWFKIADHRIAVICGAISGNAEMLDFDNSGSAYADWVAKIDPELFNKLVVERSPRGGFHVVYRCSEAVITGNTKLAMSEDSKQVLIETRGEGGYFLCAPSAGYELIQSNLSELQDITSAEREQLLWAARQLNKAPVIPKPEPRAATPATSSEDSPIDEYNARNTFRDILESNNWLYMETKGDNAFYCRPGKDPKDGHGASVKNDQVLYVYSTNAHPFEPERGYSKFQTYALLKFGGDESAAAKSILQARPMDNTYAVAHDPDPAKPALRGADLLAELKRVREAAKPAEADADEWPAFADGAEILRNPPVRPEDLIEGFCFMGAKISMSGPSKSMKTFFQIHISASVATGSQWFGRSTRKGPVLYVNFELRPWTFQNRLSLILKKMHTVIENGMLDVWHLRGKKVTIERLEKEIKKRIGERQYSLIVFDPLYKILGTRSENDASEMADLLGRLEVIAHDADAAYIVAHHFSKGNASSKTAIDRSAGSGVVARDGDAIITLSPHEDGDCLSMECTVRDHAPVKPVVLRWTYPVFEIDEGLNPKALAKPGPELIPVRVEDIFAALTEEFQTRKQIEDAVKKKTGRGERAIKSAFVAAYETGLIRMRTSSRPGTNPEKLFARGDQTP